MQKYQHVSKDEMIQMLNQEMNNFNSQHSYTEEELNDIDDIEIEKDSFLIKLKQKTYIMDLDKMKLEEVIEG